MLDDGVALFKEGEAFAQYFSARKAESASGGNKEDAQEKVSG